MDHQHVQHGVAVGVLAIGVSSLGQKQTHTLLLTQTGSEAQWVLTPVHVPVGKSGGVTVGKHPSTRTCCEKCGSYSGCSTQYTYL